MSLESCRTSVFTFQSSVHSSHVLRCLNEQRQKDLLCDVTVAVESQSFRAHRSILASCSDYFSARMSSHTGQGLVINLPEEVTAEGFEPLLQFAYTSKLLFTKENVLEIRNCATVLGFKNLDKACFDFLLPKFFDSSKNSSKGSRKQCCKTKCWRSQAESSFKGDDADEAQETSLVSPCATLEKKELSSPNKIGENAESQTETHVETEQELETESRPDYSLLCPKYRKFQLACGKGSSYMDTCAPEAENTNSACLLNCLPCSSSGDCKAVVTSKDPPGDDVKDAVTPFCCPLGKQAPTETPLSLCPGQASVQFCREAAEASCPATAPATAGEGGESLAARLKGKEAIISDCCTGPACPSPCSTLRADQRSTVEIEVANQLTSWPDVCGPRASASAPDTTRRTSEMHWLRQLELGPRPVDCPFLRDLDAVDAQVRGSEKLLLSAESPYISMLSGEDSDSFDTEGDSESYTNERASEMQLPFSVDRIASLSRNDFQQMLKTHSLTREQLDFVHDVRRRSKNRIAARRCRKRKLDCIHNLECEIERLRSEKEKLTAEKRQLDQLKLKTWQSYSGLYERLCTEANLQPEQVQVFAKYTSLADCPFKAHLSTKACIYHCPESELQPLAAGLAADAVVCEPKPSTSSTLEPPAVGVNGKTQSPSGPLAGLPDPHPTDFPHTEESTMTSATHICPDQISKLETDE
ncbi:transcription regulator protein BACH1b [Pygocentrus nattereri]|uniref:BTB and CNC homology 1, basic leucine zipper transcription factor 1 b n=1 Tax=Pygocentrus nattereri TaxID=42514 RepID=A0A3B4CLA0_PYGNA|nr:transcription regulator protein BACH1b [Pygocentrus nattereri]XP_017546908.2 transcription regulator protein BACH1b [Pygocentrus nattereri]XP_017546909.2 transcription regulator protein BACH1b [Pygocentrus nattereri]